MATPRLLLGRLLPEGHGLRIVTKTPPVSDDVIERRHCLQWLQSFERSLERLRVDSLYGLLVHHAADLGKPGWEHLVEALHALKSRGMVGRIGVSVYDEQQLDLAESRFRLELVQLPLNALDRRPIESGLLARLKAQGSEIHARSVFLQGLLLMPPSDLPEFFEPVRPALARLHDEWAQRGLSPLAACLAFVLRQPEIDAAVVGVNSLAEFDEIADAVAAAGGIRRRVRSTARDRAAVSRSVALAGAALSAARSVDAMRSSSHRTVGGISLRRISRHRGGARDALPGDCRSDEIGRVAYRVL